MLTRLAFTQAVVVRGGKIFSSSLHAMEICAAWNVLLWILQGSQGKAMIASVRHVHTHGLPVFYLPRCQKLQHRDCDCEWLTCMSSGRETVRQCLRCCILQARRPPCPRSHPSSQVRSAPSLRDHSPHLPPIYYNAFFTCC
jgi:hypothetical protein